jgi:hypothetical protein
MSRLDYWLNEASRGLSKDSAAQVRSEIQAHYEAARETAIGNGATVDEADRFAVTALGDADDANRQYRKVLLTSAEARLLREGNWEARAFCSSAWVKWLFAAPPAAALLIGTALFLTGATGLAQVLLMAGTGMGLLFAAPLLPIYTPHRARIFRCVKWVVLVAMLVLAFGPRALKWSWLLTSCLWPMAWVEWTRMSIRRKLPVAKWPKQLYF